MAFSGLFGRTTILANRHARRKARALARRAGRRSTAMPPLPRFRGLEQLEPRTLLSATLGGFEIDGNVLGSGPESDAVSFDDPAGSVAELGAVNAKYNKFGVIGEHIPTVADPTLGYTDVNPGNDIATVWLDTNISAGDIYLYFAFARDASSTGQIGFEFQTNSPPIADGAPVIYENLEMVNPPGADAYTQSVIDVWNPWGNRQVGDFSLVFDTQGKDLVIVKRTYNGSGFDSETLDASVSAAMFSEDGFRGEGAVNLTEVLGGGCFSFDNIIPYSVTGNSDRADFKDVVIADFASAISIQNCGFSIDKTGDTLSKVGDTVSFTVTITNDGFAGSPAMTPSSISDSLMGALDPADFTESGIDNDLLDEGETWTLTYDLVVPEGADDPLTNSVTATFGDGMEFTQTKSDGHSVNLFQPDITIDLSGDSLSKVGDDISYTITVGTGTSSSDTPNLIGTVTDPYDGSVTDIDLAPGETYTETGTYTVVGTDTDPFTETASVTVSPDGFPNVLTESDDHEVNLFQPDITIDLSGDSLSKVGDDISYTITVGTGTSSSDTPNLIGTVTDPYDGSVTDIDLAPGETYTETGTYTVVGTDTDPFTETASVTVSPDGFPNVLTESDDHEVNLFQPDITIDLSGDSLSKVGDDISYTITVGTGTSSSDTPNLIGTVTDPYDGSVTDIDLAPGETYTETGTYTVVGTDTDPFTETASVTVSPDGFPNVLTESDDHEVNLFQPDITIDLSGDSLSKVGDDISYTITVGTGTSSSDTPNLIGTVTDPYDGSVTDIDLAPGETYTETGTYTVVGTDTDPFTETASVTVSPDGFPNVLTESDDHEVNLFQPDITIDLSGDSLSKVGDDISYTITVGTGTSSSDTPNLIGTVTDPYDGSVTDIDLAPGETYTETGTYTVVGTDTDPFTETASVTVSPNGFPNVLTESDDHEVNLFQPDITIDLSGDSLSKVGDDISYTITVGTGTSSSDTPNLIGTVTDPYDGSVTDIDLAPGETYTETGTYTVVGTDTDPFTETASVTVSPNGFPNVLTESDDHEVNLFQPSITVEKVGATFPANIGDTVTYTVVITNTSSDDTPDLILEAISDSLVDLSGAAPDESGDEDGRLEVDETWTYTYQHEVTLDDVAGLVNEVEATFNPDGFPNDITGSAIFGEAGNILLPELVVEKTPDDGLIVLDGVNPATATFTIVVSNDGDGRATNVTVEDMLPDPAGNLTWTFASGGNPGGSFTIGDDPDTMIVENDYLSGTVASLDGGASFTITVETEIPADYLSAAGTPMGDGTLGSNFEIDGNLTELDAVPPDGPAADWGSLVLAADPNNPQPGELVNAPDLPSGQQDDSLGKGSKENTDPPKVVDGSIPNNKSDLTNFLFSEDVVDGNVFLRLGFIRENTLGTANIDFELNQDETLSANGVTPIRTVGDILITFDFASGGNVVELGLREWDGSAWVNEIDLDSANAAQGAVNDGFEIDNPLTTEDPDDVLASNTFGEAIVNLTQVFGGDCRSFASAYVKSRSSDSFTSALKDFIAPIDVDINTCVTVDLPNTAFATADNFVDPGDLQPLTAEDSGLIQITNDPLSGSGLLGSEVDLIAEAYPILNSGETSAEEAEEEDAAGKRIRGVLDYGVDLLAV